MLDLERLHRFRSLLPWDSGGTFNVVQRHIPIREARFVPGLGDGFAGVWDRERPEEPIARFRDTDEGQSQAEGLATKLLFEDAFAQRLVPGERLYVSWEEPRWVPRASFGEIATDERMKKMLGGHRVGPAYFQTWPGPWLLLEEDDGEQWPPIPPTGNPGRWFLYVFAYEGSDDCFDLLCEGFFATRKEAQAYAARVYSTEGPWMPVPDDVPRDLLATIRWASSRRPERSVG